MMNDIRRPRRAWPPTARTAAAIIAAAALALLVAACSGSGSGGSSNAVASTNSQALAYSHCMRSHGLRHFPDPSSNGQIPKTSAQQLGVSDSQFQAAQTACRPSANQAGPPTQAGLLQAWSNTRKFARCMRSHGVSNWPDPTGDPEHHPERPTFNLQPVGIDPNSPQINTNIHECEPLLNGWSPYLNGEAGQTNLGGS
jgi:hypothetical protein